ncbi:MAG TPA: glycosyltransferase family 4 protein [Stellaceae bacterium]
MTPLVFLVPGPLAQITGGYLFDRRVVEGMRAAGRRVDVHELPGRFTAGDPVAAAAVRAVLAALPDGTAVAFEGLALPGVAPALAGDDSGGGTAERLRLVAFLHHPLASETGLPPGEAAALAAIERACLPRLAGVICPSRAAAAAVAAYGVAPDRIAVVPPGLDRPASPPEPSPANGGPVRLLCVATLTPRKGHLVLLDALAQLADLDWRLVCIGGVDRDSATAEAVRARIAEDGTLRGRVTLAGEWQPDRLGEAYAAADLFVLPSFHEGFGMAYAEAMAYGLPVVATDAGAIPQTVPRDTAGLLVPPGDPAALAAALRRAISDPALRLRLRSGALAAASRLPGWPETVRRWGEAFDRLVS